MDLTTAAILDAELTELTAPRSAETTSASRGDAPIDMSPAPIPADWRISGDPNPRVKYLSCSPDGGFMSGIWTCEPAVFRFQYDNCDETVHIIAGVAEVKLGDEILLLQPGAVAYFPRGSFAIWTVHEPIHKYFAIRNRSRAVRKLKRISDRLLRRNSRPGAL